MTRLFISDLHLTAQRADIGAAFLQFLAGPAREAEALYILGDLFEVWLGDDAILDEYLPFITALKALSDSGVDLYVMRGNRDFLLGEGFAAMTGASLLPDPTVIDLYGTPTLLMHGDLLCTDDVEYQKFRLMVRDPAWQRAFLAESVEKRQEYAQGLRDVSKEATRSKQEAIMDVNQGEVVKALRDHGVTQMIHGHTHRPRFHSLTVDGHPARRIVLPEWYTQGSVLECTSAGCVQQPI